MSRITKSKDRIKTHAEVYTPIRIVKSMVDLVEQGADDDIWDIGKTWLEPSCGNGVFIGEIVRRKLARCETASMALEALKDVYAIDIQEDNIYQARCQALGQYIKWCIKNEMVCHFGEVSKIIDTNIICGDSLKPESVSLFDWKENKHVTLKILEEV